MRAKMRVDSHILLEDSTSKITAAQRARRCAAGSSTAPSSSARPIPRHEHKFRKKCGQIEKRGPQTLSHPGRRIEYHRRSRLRQCRDQFVTSRMSQGLAWIVVCTARCTTAADPGLPGPVSQNYRCSASAFAPATGENVSISPVPPPALRCCRSGTSARMSSPMATMSSWDMGLDAGIPRCRPERGPRPDRGVLDPVYTGEGPRR